MNRGHVVALTCAVVIAPYARVVAQTTISGITASPARPAIGEPVAVTISGSGSLSGLSFYVIQYAIGIVTPIGNPIVLTSFPMNVSTTFAKPAVYLLEVRGQGPALYRDSVTAVWPFVSDIAPATGLVAGKTATITVVGHGKPCSALGVDFGDGTGLITLSNVAFPLALQHTFTKAGSFTVSAAGTRAVTIGTSTSSCTGQASRIVSVSVPRTTGDVVPSTNP